MLKKDFLTNIYKRRIITKKKEVVPSFKKFRNILGKLRKKKNSKFIVRFTQNNLFLTLVNANSTSRTIFLSGGSFGFNGRSRHSQESIQQVLDKFLEFISEEPLGAFGVELVGYGRLRRLFLRRLGALSRVRSYRAATSSFSRIASPKNGTRLRLPLASCVYVKERKNIPFNGCRLRKPRRK